MFSLSLRGSSVPVDMCVLAVTFKLVASILSYKCELILTLSVETLKGNFES